MLAVCWWSRTKHFSPLGTKSYFHVNSSRKNSVVLKNNTPPTWPPCHVVAIQEYNSDKTASYPSELIKLYLIGISQKIAKKKKKKKKYIYIYIYTLASVN